MGTRQIYENKRVGGKILETKELWGDRRGRNCLAGGCGGEGQLRGSLIVTLYSQDTLYL
jgi:hypothetical protein